MSVFTSEWLTEQARKAAAEEDLPPTSRPTGKPTGPKRMVLSSEWLSEQARRAAQEEELPPTGRPTGKPLPKEARPDLAVVRLPPHLLDQLQALWEQRKKKGHQESIEELCALLLQRAFRHAEEDEAKEGTQAP